MAQLHLHFSPNAIQSGCGLFHYILKHNVKETWHILNTLSPITKTTSAKLLTVAQRWNYTEMVSQLNRNVHTEHSNCSCMARSRWLCASVSVYCSLYRWYGKEHRNIASKNKNCEMLLRLCIESHIGTKRNGWTNERWAVWTTATNGTIIYSHQNV